MGRPTPTPLKWASAARIYGLLPRNALATADRVVDVQKRNQPGPCKSASGPTRTPAGRFVRSQAPITSGAERVRKGLMR